VTRSSFISKSYLLWVVLAVLILFLLLPSFVKASEESDKAAALRSVAQQLIDVGAEQYKRGYYSAAQQTLERAGENKQYLSDSDQKRLADLLGKIRAAGGERQIIYDRMKDAETYAKNKDYVRAVSALSLIQNSQYLTKAEQARVQSDLKSYKQELKKQGEDMAGVFARSVKQYNEGNLEEARKGFEVVAASGLILVSDGKSAKEYIAKIDEQTGGTTAVKSPAAAETKPAGAGAAEEELLSERIPATAAEKMAPQPAQPQPPVEVKQPVTAQPPIEVKPVEAAAPVGQTAAAAPSAASAAKDSAQCAPVEGSYIDKVMQQRNIQRSYTEAIVDDAVSKAKKQVSEGKFEAARESVSSARRIVDNNKMLLGDEMYKRMNDTLNSINNEIETKSAAAATFEQQQKQKQAVTLQKELRQQQETERSQRINDLMSKAMALQRQQRYEDARGQLEMVLAIDPLNEQALTMHQTLTDMINYRKQLEVRKEIGEQTLETMVNADKSNIPHADEMTYPRDWRELTSKRGPTEAAGMSPADKETYDQLAKTVDLSRLSPDMTFADAIELLRNSVEPPLKIVVMWPDLQTNADIQRTTRINMEPISAIPLEKALSLLLSSVSSAGVELGYIIEDGVITIATKASLPTKMIQRVYNISDLLGLPANFFTDLTNTGLGQIQQGTTLGGGGGGGGGQRQTMQQGQTTQQLSAQQMAAEALARIQEVTAMIQEIEPDSWYPTGKGTVRVWSNNSLIVVQTAEVHQQIAKVIEDLRASMNLGQQVAIEARFLLVTENFLEDIGFDVDFVQKLGDEWGPLEVTQTNLADTRGTLVTGLPAPTNPPAIQIHGSYGTVLDDLQVQFLIKATQENTNARSLQAPRVTVLNGESATLSVTNDQSYISNFQVQQSAASAGVGNASTIFATLQPTVSTITSGVILNITPTISADKKYVTLRILTNNTALLSLEPFPVEVIGGQPPVDIFIPNLQTTQVQTRITVPDKGTLLLGGQKLTDETDQEAGVPILGKLPVLGRLFNNRSTSRDQKVLLILVTPTIILNQEREEAAVAGLKTTGL
jgi:type II secretory pathway component GspD/PulD (secretin)